MSPPGHTRMSRTLVLYRMQDPESMSRSLLLHRIRGTRA